MTIIHPPTDGNDESHIHAVDPPHEKRTIMATGNAEGLGELIGRRKVLLHSASIGLSLLGATIAPKPSKEKTGKNEFASVARDYGTQETYDWAEDYFHTNAPAQPDRPNDQGGHLAWGQSHILRSYLMMYKAFGDLKYLNCLVRNVDQILASRDIIRNVVDYRGHSRPVWRTGHPSTSGGVNINSSTGQPVIRVRSGIQSVNDITISISSGPSADRFSITASKGSASESFANLSMDPQSPDYVVSRLNAANPTPFRTTAVDRRTNPTGPTPVPNPGQYALTSLYYTFAVDTGMIVAAIAEFVEIVYADPALAASFGAKADSYAAAVVDAIAAHDADWRQNAAGEGWYIAEKGSPCHFDGCEAPHNQNLAVAIAQMHIGTATGNTQLLDRAYRILTKFRNDLVLHSDRYLWSYWWSKGKKYSGYSIADGVSDYSPSMPANHTIEDVSHGAIDMWAAVEAHRHNLVFTSQDLQRFALTFTENACTTTPSGAPTTFRYLSGQGTLGTHDLPAGLWAVLTPWRPAVHTFLRGLYNHLQPIPLNGHTVASIAAIAAANQYLTESSN